MSAELAQEENETEGIGLRFVESSTGTRHLAVEPGPNECLCGYVNYTHPIRQGATAVITTEKLCDNCRISANNEHGDKLLRLYEMADEHEFASRGGE